MPASGIQGAAYLKPLSSWSAGPAQDRGAGYRGLPAVALLGVSEVVKAGQTYGSITPDTIMKPHSAISIATFQRRERTTKRAADRARIDRPATM